MSLSRDSRQEQKLKAIRLAQFRLQQRLDMIDWREDVLLPEVEALKSGKSVLGLPEGVAFDIEVVSEAEDTPAHNRGPVSAARPRVARRPKAALKAAARS